jgi:hypothetical protein
MSFCKLFEISVNEQLATYSTMYEEHSKQIYRHWYTVFEVLTFGVEVPIIVAISYSIFEVAGTHKLISADRLLF